MTTNQTFRYIASRGAKVIAQMSNYQSELLQSIDNIYHCSDKLRKEGQKSDMYSSRAATEIIMSAIYRLSIDVDMVLRLVNGLLEILDEAEKQNLRKMEIKEAKARRHQEDEERQREERAQEGRERDERVRKMLGDELRKLHGSLYPIQPQPTVSFSQLSSIGH